MNNTDNRRHSPEFLKEFGKRVRDLRKEKGVSIEQARKALGVPRSTYSGWELGHRIPLSKSLDSLSEYLDTSTDYLMQKTNRKHPTDPNDLKHILKDNEIIWDGKRLSDAQTDFIAEVINAYLKNEKTTP